MGFDTSAAAYERARPSYPPEAVRDLVDRLGIGPGRTVLDLAAGTGKLTRLLVPSGARVMAVEPSAPMRDQLEAAVPGVEVLPGTAEELPFGDSTFDGVVVAQAFHWFDGPRALAEIHRVLKPHGGLALAWNVRDRTVEWTQKLAELTEPYRSGGPKYRDGKWEEAFAATTLFTPLEKQEYPFEHDVDAETMVERMASISWIAVLPDAERLPLLDRIRALLADMPERFPVPYHTELWWCRAIK
ncbi:MAG TPA: methyltransferase domain-containing protein [Actinomycetes bacterium]|nr:methyltransferase domain-containing protein [Actinomycetes bacterium]